MTREEAKLKIEWIRDGNDFTPTDAQVIALDMAIEALQEPKTIIGIDIPYGSDKGIATIFKGNEKMVLEEVKEIMAVVRCKDCKHYDKHETWSACTYWSGDPYEQASVGDNDYCSFGERVEE